MCFIIQTLMFSLALDEWGTRLQGEVRVTPPGSCLVFLECIVIVDMQGNWQLSGAFFVALDQHPSLLWVQSCLFFSTRVDEDTLSCTSKYIDKCGCFGTFMFNVQQLLLEFIASRKD